MVLSNSHLNVERGKIQRPQKAAIYGPEGIGKSFLAAQFPHPVFLDTERGTHHLDIARFSKIDTWDDIINAINEAITKKHDFQTLVIDTVDWLEKRLSEYICRKANKDSIEDFGYGKGYVLLAEGFSSLLASLEAVIKRGMHVVFLAHSTVSRFELPDQTGSYDRYELKLSKRVAPLLKEWTDLMLFGNYVTKITQNESGKKRGVGGRERMLFATHAAAFDAKNRHGLPDNLPFRFESIAHIFTGVPTFSAKELNDTKSTDERFAELFKGQEQAVREFLIARNQIQENGTWADLAPDYVARILSQPELFLQAVMEFRTDDIPQ